jgi:hypothetical protein
MMAAYEILCLFHSSLRLVIAISQCVCRYLGVQLYLRAAFDIRAYERTDFLGRHVSCDQVARLLQNRGKYHYSARRFWNTC